MVLDDWVLVNLGLGILAEIYGVILSFLTDIMSFFVRVSIQVTMSGSCRVEVGVFD